MLVVHLPPPTAVIRPLGDFRHSSVAQGDVGLAVQSELTELARHWLQTESSGKAGSENDDYQHVPLETARTIRVRYRPATALAPRVVADTDIG